MIKSTRSPVVALAALGVAAAAGLVGCGNGIEVAGPSASDSPLLASPSSPKASATSKSAEPSGSSPSEQPSSPNDTTTAGGHHSGSGGSGNGGSNGGGGNGGGPAAGTQTSAPSDGGGQPPAQGPAKCTLGDLDIGVRVPPGSGAAGSQYVLLTFTNTSQQPCTIYGYAGVSFVGNQNGTQLGNPAVRDRSRAPSTVRVAPGNKRAELLQIVDAGNFNPEKCQPTTSDGFRVYPPDSFTAAYVPFKTAACQGDVNQLTVFPVGIKD